MSGILRNTKHVYDCSNILNCYIDHVYPAPILKKNKFNFNDFETSKIAALVDEVLVDEAVLDKYKLRGDDFICFNLRTGYMTEHTEKMHGFRSSDPAEVAPLLEHLKSLNKKIVNLSNFRFDGMLNIVHSVDYLSSDIFTLIARSALYIGDSSGPIVYAQLIGKVTYGYNMFPLYLKPNKNSHFSYMGIEGYTELHNYLHDEKLLRENHVVVKRGKIDLDEFNKFWERI